MHGVTLFGITMRVNYNCFKGQGHSKNRISFVATNKYFTLSRVSYRFLVSKVAPILMKTHLKVAKVHRHFE